MIDGPAGLAILGSRSGPFLSQQSETEVPQLCQFAVELLLSLVCREGVEQVRKLHAVAHDLPAT